MLMSMRNTHPKLQFTHLLPYGAVIHENGTQFVVFSRHATEMRLLLYDNVDDRDPVEIINFDPDKNRWGDIWSVFVPDVGSGQLYHFQAGGPNDPSRASNANQKDSAKKDSVKKNTSSFKSLEEFSCWLDLQLEILEKNNREFETSDSVRSFFKR